MSDADVFCAGETVSLPNVPERRSDRPLSAPQPPSLDQGLDWEPAQVMAKLPTAAGTGTEVETVTEPCSVFTSSLQSG